MNKEKTFTTDDVYTAALNFKLDELKIMQNSFDKKEFAHMVYVTGMALENDPYHLRQALIYQAYDLDPTLYEKDKKTLEDNRQKEVDIHFLKETLEDYIPGDSQKPYLKNIDELDSNIEYSRASIQREIKDRITSCFFPDKNGFKLIVNKAHKNNYNLNLKRLTEDVIFQQNSFIPFALEVIEKVWEKQEGKPKSEYYNYIKNRVFDCPKYMNSEDILDFVYSKEPEQIIVDMNKWQKGQYKDTVGSYIIDSYFEDKQNIIKDTVSSKRPKP